MIWIFKASCMKQHLITIFLLLVATFAFVLRYFVNEHVQEWCDVQAFALPTLAAVVEMILSERSGRKIEEELKKRPPFEYLSEEEYERRKAEGTIDENTLYATGE